MKLQQFSIIFLQKLLSKRWRLWPPWLQATMDFDLFLSKLGYRVLALFTLRKTKADITEDTSIKLIQTTKIWSKNICVCINIWKLLWKCTHHWLLFLQASKPNKPRILSFTNQLVGNVTSTLIKYFKFTWSQLCFCHQQKGCGVLVVFTIY